MQDDPRYEDVVADVHGFFTQRLIVPPAKWPGSPRRSCWLDPGFGFGKTLEHNLLLLRQLYAIRRARSVPVLAGASRKRFLGALTGRAEAERVAGGPWRPTCWPSSAGAHMFRVHDVAATRDALTVAAATVDDSSAEVRIRRE